MLNMNEFINTSMINTTGNEKFFEACQSFIKTSPADIENSPKSVLNKHGDNYKDSEENNNKENEKYESTKNLIKMKNISSKSSRIFVLVLSEETGDVHIKELSSLNVSTPLRKFKNKNNKKKENSSLPKALKEKYVFASDAECIKALEAMNISQKSFKQNDSNRGIFATVTYAFQNALKNLSGGTVIENISNAASNNTTASLNSVLPLPIHNSTSIGCDEGSCVFEFQTSKELNKDTDFSSNLADDLPFKTCDENMSPLNILRSPRHKKRSTNWYKHIHGRPPILRMRNASCVHSRRIKQRGNTIESNVFSFFTRPFQIDKSTQTD